MKNDLKKLRPLVDADQMLYSSGFSADAAMMKDFMETVGCDKEKARELAYEEDYLHHALGNFKQALVNSIEPFDSDKAEFYLTGVGNYREDIATIAPYKGNRDTTHKPRYYKEMRKYAVEVWGATIIDGMEADDAVSIGQWAKRDRSTVIISGDKDLLNTPGHHYNPRKEEYVYVTLAEADRNFWMQGATGDATDNIKGLHRIGTKTVWKEWEKHRDLERFKDWVRRGYDKQYGPEGEHAMWENLTLVWMLREPWVNWDGGDVRSVGYDEGGEEGEKESPEQGTEV